MFRLILASVLVAYAAAQAYHGDPRTAAIISEQRYLSGDGKFGAAYTQEDGTDFKEETDADGTRRGSYSYVDPSGQTRTIKYTAGKNGFVAQGADIPVAPAPPPHAAPAAQYQPEPRYNPAPAQASYAPVPAARSYLNDNDFINSGQYDDRFNDPNFAPNKAAPVYNQQYTQPAPQQQQAYQPAPLPKPVQHNYQPQPQQPYFPPQNQYTTEQPHRFQPPGKLSLNRTPDGFSYQFNKA